MTYPDGEVLTYDYDSQGNLQSIVNGDSFTYLENMLYDEAGRISEMDLGSDILEKNFNYYAWDVSTVGGSLSNMTAAQVGGSTLQDIDYSYDANGNITEIDSDIAGETSTYTYDALNRLTSAVVNDGATDIFTEAFGYNSTNGNLEHKGESTSNWNLYEYNASQPHAVTHVGDSANQRYWYDANGNMIKRIEADDEERLLSYDAENRLISVLPTNVPSATPTATETQTETATSTATATQTATLEETPTPTASQETTATDTLEATQVETSEPTSVTPEATEVPSNTPEATEVSSDTPEATEIPSNTPEATEVANDTPEATEVPSDTPEATEVPSDTPEATEVPSETPEPSETTEATVENTATPTLIETSAAADTDIPVPTTDESATATLTETSSGTATSTPTLTPTETETETATAMTTATLAGTPTEAPPAPFESAYYTYDGDDNMVMSVINGITTYYASSSYVVELDGSDTTVRKTYSAGSTSLAVRTIVNGTENTLNWMLSDHLGSSSITTAADGTWNSEIRYSAFGETRYSSGITPTDYRYTGQLEQKDVNLYYYNARYYDAALGRFIQADTIIPGAGDSKSYDRYAYVNNNPVRYTDPSGHIIPDEIDQPGGRGYKPTPDPTPSAPVSKPIVRIRCGIGSWIACSTEDGENMGEDQRPAYSDQYPLQPLVTMLRDNGYEVILMDPYLETVIAEDEMPDEVKLPSEFPLMQDLTYIDIGFSYGAKGSLEEAESNPEQVIMLILLDPPDEGMGVNTDYPGIIYLAYSLTDYIDQDNPNQNQHYFDPVVYNFDPNQLVHTQLSVNEKVAEEILEFILGNQ